MIERRDDWDIWTEIYGPTPATVGLIARLCHLSERQVTRVIELAHSLEVRVDHRRTCACGHRYNVHATGGTKCLAAGNLGEGSGSMCGCYEWQP